MPLRLVFSAPPASAGSSTSTASLPRASASIRAREVRLPVSSSEVTSIATVPDGAGAASNTARVASSPIATPTFMSSDAGAVELAVAACRRHAGQLAERPHRVDVADQQHPRSATADLEHGVVAGIGTGLDAAAQTHGGGAVP